MVIDERCSLVFLSHTQMRHQTSTDSPFLRKQFSKSYRFLLSPRFACCEERHLLVVRLVFACSHFSQEAQMLPHLPQASQDPRRLPKITEAHSGPKKEVPVIKSV